MAFSILKGPFSDEKLIYGGGLFFGDFAKFGPHTDYDLPPIGDPVTGQSAIDQ